MRQGYLLLTMLLLGCGTKKTEVTSDYKGGGETFNDFFDKFKSDSVFQAERVRFPLVWLSWGDNHLSTETIESDHWRHLSLDYNAEFGSREIDAYTQETKIYSDSAKLELRGVDNGIFVDYVFNKVDGRWNLITVRDYSD